MNAGVYLAACLSVWGGTFTMCPVQTGQTTFYNVDRKKEPTEKVGVVIKLL